MKNFGAVTVALTAFSSLVAADFSIYAQDIGSSGISGAGRGWQVYPAGDKVLCKDTKEWIFATSDDVSGGKYGVRCAENDNGQGKACGVYDGANSRNIQELEFNARQASSETNKAHFTYYAVSGEMVNLQGKVIGHCTPSAATKYTACGQTIGQSLIERKLNCVSHLTPAQFPKPG